MKKQSIKKVLAILNRGGVIAHPTETCYGFACDATNKKALQRLYRLKKMPRNKPVSVLVDSLKNAKKYGIFNKRALRFAKKYWPGPLTLVVKRKTSLPVFLNPGIKTIGIRIPAHALSLALSRAFGKPITTTSANISRQPSPYSTSEIKRQFKKQKLKPDFYIENGRIANNPPSTIVDFSKSKPHVIRQGALFLGRAK